jgi:hypothetical protein
MDRLVAISGIAKYTQQLANDQYYAGLWKRCLMHDLLWKMSNGMQRRRPTDYRAPTWSRGSMNGEIVYNCANEAGSRALPTVIDVQTEAFEISQVTNRGLIIHGPMTEMI